MNKWSDVAALAQKLRLISDSAKANGYLEDHLLETERHMKVLEAEGANLHAQLTAALDDKLLEHNNLIKALHEIETNKKELADAKLREASLKTQLSKPTDAATDLMQANAAMAALQKKYDADMAKAKARETELKTALDSFTAIGNNVAAKP